MNHRTATANRPHPRRNFAYLALLLAVLLLAACASAGRHVDRTHLGEIENGAQTRSQIEAWFGKPYSVKTGLVGHPNGCTERWSYEFAKAKGFGTVTYREALVVDFDPQGRVCDHAFSQAGAE